MERPPVDRMDLDGRDEDRAAPSCRRSTGRPGRSGRCGGGAARTRGRRSRRCPSRSRGRRRRPAGGRHGGGGRPSCRSGRDVRRPASRGRWTWMGTSGWSVSVGSGCGSPAGPEWRGARVARVRVPRVVRARATQRRRRTRPRRGAICGVAPRCSIPDVAATILIVEDEHAVARGIQYALQQEGYEVAVARSGEEGLEIGTKQAPDLVVLDVRLPGHRRLRGPAPPARGRRQDAGPRPDRARRRGRQGHRPRARRRRLPDQAVRAARADEPDQGAPAPLVRRPVRRGRWPGHPPRRPAHRPRAPARPARRPAGSA